MSDIPEIRTTSDWAEWKRILTPAQVLCLSTESITLRPSSKRVSIASVQYFLETIRQQIQRKDCLLLAPFQSVHFRRLVHMPPTWLWGQDLNELQPSLLSISIQRLQWWYHLRLPSKSVLCPRPKPIWLSNAQCFSANLLSSEFFLSRVLYPIITILSVSNFLLRYNDIWSQIMTVDTVTPANGSTFELT